MKVMYYLVSASAVICFVLAYLGFWDSNRFVYALRSLTVALFCVYVSRLIKPKDE